MEKARTPQAPPDPDEYRPALQHYQYPPDLRIDPYPPGYSPRETPQHGAPVPPVASYTFTETTTSRGPFATTSTQIHRDGKSPKEKGGSLFGSLTKAGADLMGKGLVATNKAVDFVSAKLDETIQKHYYDKSPTMNLFQTGNVIQLISKTTGRTMQLLQAANGQLILDANGPDNPQAFNTHFIVTREPDNVVTLHNNHNYIAIVNGFTTIHRAAEQGHVTLHCRLRLHEPSDKYVSLESVQEKNNTIGVTANGSLKSALATRAMDKDAYFAVRLVYSPHGAPPTINSRNRPN